MGSRTLSDHLEFDGLSHSAGQLQQCAQRSGTHLSRISLHCHQNSHAKTRRHNQLNGRLGPVAQVAQLLIDGHDRKSRISGRDGEREQIAGSSEAKVSIGDATSRTCSIGNIILSSSSFSWIAFIFASPSSCEGRQRGER